MGIKDFYNVLKTECPEQIVTYHLSEFTGYRVAIDISIFLYRYIRTAGPIKWMSPFILLLCTLKKFGIKVVCIFDGPNPPPEKKLEQERRRATLKVSINRLEECIRVRDIIRDDYILYDLLMEAQLKKDCKILINGKRPRKMDVTNYDSPSDIIDSLNGTIEKLTNQTLPILPIYTEQAKMLVKTLGISCFQSDGEAETLCAYLAIKGDVDAVLTEDTDVMAYGTPFMLAFKSFKLSENKVVGLHHKCILEALSMNQDEFRDLCILLSCDYNKRVKGYPPDGKTHKKPIGIGLKGALAMIHEYRRLEEVSKHVVDCTPLKYHRCRELFTVPEKIKDVIVPIYGPPDFKTMEEYIKKYSITVGIEYIQSCWKPTQMDFLDESTEELYTDSDVSDDEKGKEEYEPFLPPAKFVKLSEEVFSED